MSEDVNKVLIPAPLVEQIEDDDEFDEWCWNGFSIKADRLYDLWSELADLIPAIDSHGTQGIVCVFHIGNSRDGSLYHETSIPLSELMSVVSEMANLGCDLNEVKVQSYMYYNSVDEPFLF